MTVAIRRPVFAYLLSTVVLFLIHIVEPMLLLMCELSLRNNRTSQMPQIDQCCSRLLYTRGYIVRYATSKNKALLWIFPAFQLRFALWRYKPHTKRTYIIVYLMEKSLHLLEFSLSSTTLNTYSKSDSLPCEQMTMSLSSYKDKVIHIIISIKRMESDNCGEQHFWWWTCVKDDSMHERGSGFAKGGIEKVECIPLVLSVVRIASNGL